MWRKGKVPLGIGLIGCGAIGAILAKAVDEGRAGDACLVVVFDENLKKAVDLAQKLKSKPKVARNFNELIECEDVKLVVEAASQEAVKAYAIEVLRAGKDLMVMSVGALVDSKLTSEINRIAKENGRKIYVPSGAIAGLDGVKASAIDKIEKVVLTTRKPLKALSDNLYFKEKFGGKVEELTVIYEGPALEACRLFPANVNVAATLSLVGVGAEKTVVRVVADPALERNVHEIEVKGEFGDLVVRVENVPSRENPKTSYLAALSAIATLRKITEPIVIGT
ncbi:MAG: aspartate dehydrogenase [Candidatus Bathyarchaeota archaeon]|nr:aspartate dehydrogenase [Candidatus Bathyarchaeota archaeon]